MDAWVVFAAAAAAASLINVVASLVRSREERERTRKVVMVVGSRRGFGCGCRRSIGCYNARENFGG